jgi:hypothetical protein
MHRLRDMLGAGYASNTLPVALCYFAPLLFLFVLPLPQPFVAGTDPAWQALLPAMFLRHAVFGKDFAFTYGPWGFLQEARGFPAAYPWMLAGRLFLAAALSWGAAMVIVRSISGKYRPRLLALLLGVTASPFFLLYLVAALLMAQQPRSRSAIATVLAACALAAHAKFGLAVLFVSVLVLLAAWSIAEFGLIWTIPWALAWYAAFWLAAGQPLTALPAYWTSSLITAGTYSQAIYESAPESVAVMAALVIAAVALAAAFGWTRLRWWTLLWMAAYFFMAFKQVSVRQDRVHIWENGVRWMFPAALLAGICAIGTEPRSRLVLRRGDKPDRELPWVYVWTAATIACAVVLTFSAQLRGGIPKEMFQSLARLRLLPSGPAAWAREFENAKAELARQEPLKKVDGASELLGPEPSVLIASGNDWVVSPVPQTYATYTPRLAQLNAAYLEGPDAPPNVFLRIHSEIRVPSTEDSLALLTLLRYYEPAEFAGHYLLLRRAQDPAPLRRELLLERTVELGEKLDIPASPQDLLWIEIGMHPTLAGQLLQTLYRSPGASCEIDAGGIIETRDLIPDIASSGFLLSPWITDAVSFALLYGGPQTVSVLPDVRSIRLIATRMRRLAYGSRLPVRIYRVSTPVRPLPGPGPEIRELANSGEAPATIRSFPGRPAWDLQDGTPRLTVPAVSRGTVSMDRAAGVLLQFGTDERCRQPVEFTARLEGQPERTVMSEHVCGPAKKEIRWSQAYSGKLILETKCDADCATSAYWSGITTLK